MSQTNAELTWPVRTHAGAGMTVLMSPVSIRNVTGTYGPGYGLHTISVMYITDTGNDHATQLQLHCTAREEVLDWSCNGRRKCVTKGWKNKTASLSLTL